MASKRPPKSSKAAKSRKTIKPEPEPDEGLVNPSKGDKIRAELEAIHSKSPDGLLHRKDIVEFARNSNTALHGEFIWDDSVAAERYRLERAGRVVMQVMVTIVEGKPRQRQWVSIHENRVNRGGYTLTVDVLSDEGKRKQLLAAAWAEFQTFKSKYDHLVELAELFEKADEMKSRSRRRTA